MSNTLHAFDFLKPGEAQAKGAAPLVAVFGDDYFLRLNVLHSLREVVLGEGHRDVPYATFSGDTAEWRDISDELSTVSLFGGSGPRLVIVDDADKFVTKYRAQLEDYLAKAQKRSVLILAVQTWPANTRIYKTVDKSGLQIDCRPPQVKRGKQIDQPRIVQWMVSWGKQRHEIQLDSRAASLLLEITGPDFGMLDQSLAKLALYVQPNETVTVDMVKDYVGGWKTNTTWELIEAAGDGNVASALTQLDHLMMAGESPIGVLALVSWSLRRLTAATRIVEQGEIDGKAVSLPAALQRAGYQTWDQQGFSRAQKQLRQLGRQRAGQLSRWLLEAETAMKGSHSADDRARFLLEQLIARLGKRSTAG